MVNRTNHKPNSGSFQKGSDSRRLNTSKFLRTEELRELCKLKTEDAVATIARLMDSENESIALKAAVAMLDRAYGRPMTSVQVSGGEGAVEDMSTQELKARLVQLVRDSTEKPVQGVTIDNEPDPVGSHSESKNVAQTALCAPSEDCG